MSSTYRPICLSHAPPLVIDIEVTAQVPPLQPEGHPDCIIALGRWSGALVAVWLPIRRSDGNEWREGDWFDVSWCYRFPQLLDMLKADT